MSTDVEAFDLACRAGDINRVRSLVEAGFEAYLYIDQIWKIIFDTVQDPLFEWLVDYIRRHPLNAILSGDLYKWSRCQIFQYRLYVAIRDSRPIDTVYELMSEYTEPYKHHVNIDVALVMKLIHISPPVPAVQALREFLLERNLEIIRSFERENSMDVDQSIFDEITKNRAMDHVEVLWDYVDENYDTNHDHRRHWALIQGADPEIRDRILRSIVRGSPRPYSDLTRYDLLQSLLSAGYPDLHAHLSDEYEKAGLEVQDNPWQPRCAPEEELLHRFRKLTMILRHKTTIPEAFVTMEEIRRLLRGNTLAIKEGSYPSSLAIILLYSAISRGAREETRNVTVHESYMMWVDRREPARELPQDPLQDPGQDPAQDPAQDPGDGYRDVEFRQRLSPNYQRLQRYFDIQNRDVRAVVISLDGDGILCRNVLGLVCEYLDN